MTTYNILNNLEEVHSIVTGTIEDAQDKVYELKEYHGFYSVFTIIEA
jgi:hypothetical protein